MNRVLIMMMIAGLTIVFQSCSHKMYPVENKTVDSVKVVKVVEYRDSLIEVPVPSESVENRTTDTTSYLRTSIAESTATISNGVLRHTLRNIDTARIRPVAPIKIPEITIKTEHRMMNTTTVVREVEKKLNGWQRFIMGAGYVFLVLSILVVGFKVFKFVRRIKGL